MRGAVAAWMVVWIVGATAAAQMAPPVPQECAKLKGTAQQTCIAKVKAAAKDAPESNPFPEEQSRHGGELERSNTSDMPTTGIPDPPAESLKPLPPSAGSSSSSSSSSSSGDATSTPADDEDAAPTTAAGDSSVRPSALKDLGSHADSSEARQKLDRTRVEDDLRVGHFYFKDGNLAGAAMRYRDALQRDPDNPDAHFGLAEVLVKQSNRDEAITHLQRYLALAPDDDHTKDAKKLLGRLQASR